MRERTLGIIAILFALLVSTQIVIAQTTPPLQIILTWQAQSFSPREFAGKAPATPSAPIAVSVTALKGGTFVELGEAAISWFLDGRFLTSGKGLQEITFTTQKREGDEYRVGAKVQHPDGVAESSVSIPVKNQEVVIDTSLPHPVLKEGSKVMLRAIPYFFTTSALQDILFFWRVNDTDRRGEGENELALSVGELGGLTRSVAVSVVAQNKKNSLESAKARMVFNVR